MCMKDRVMLTGEFGKYHIENVVGMGGMSVVYHAVDRTLNREAALKILNVQRSVNPEEVRRFQREVKIAQRLRHPNIIDIYEYGEVENFVYLAMEYMPGGSLGERFASPAPQTLGETVEVLKIIARALDFAHSQGVLHRDLKLSNILVGEHGRLALSDFGLALMPDSSRITQSGQTFGTPIYMSPEQVQGARALDHRTDLYSLGVMAYLLATGYYPFLASNSLLIMNRHLTDAPPQPSRLNPRLPEAIDWVLLKGLAKRPDDRFETAGALVNAFEEAVAPVASTEIMILTSQPTPMVEPSRYFSVPSMSGRGDQTSPLEGWNGERTPDVRALMEPVPPNAQRAQPEGGGRGIARWAGALALVAAAVILLVGLGSILPNRQEMITETLDSELIVAETTATASPTPTLTTETPSPTQTQPPTARATNTLLPTNTRRPSATPANTASPAPTTASSLLTATRRAQQTATIMALVQESETDDFAPTRIARTAVATQRTQPVEATSTRRVSSTSVPTRTTAAGIPATSVQATHVPATQIQATYVPPTSVPPTHVPPTNIPPTPVPPTPVPPTPVPPTPVPPTEAPLPTATPLLDLPLPTIPVVQTLLPGLLG